MLHLRTAEIGDLSTLLRLQEEAATSARWRESDYRRIFDPAAPRRIALLAEMRDADFAGAPAGSFPAGFLVAQIGSDVWEIENLVVAGRARRRGVGRALLAELLLRAQEAGAGSAILEVRESNQAARALYAGAGFTVVGRRTSYYYGPVEDAIIYRILLPAAAVPPSGAAFKSR